jgi:hypothetical protein
MTTTKHIKTLASIITILLILSCTALTAATTENEYNNGTDTLPAISETRHTENGYKAHIIINRDVTGACANENGYQLDLAIAPQGIGTALVENNVHLDLIPQKAVPDFVNIAMVEVTANRIVVGQGYKTSITVTLTNEGDFTETTDITLYANAITLQAFIGITIQSFETKALIFTWDTTGWIKGIAYYTKATAIPVPYETETLDNILLGDTVKVTIPGDINGDFFVNIQDVGLVAANWQKTVPPAPANVDINGDGRINIQDVGLIAANWQKHA